MSPAPYRLRFLFDPFRSNQRLPIAASVFHRLPLSLARERGLGGEGFPATAACPSPPTPNLSRPSRVLLSERAYPDRGGRLVRILREAQTHRQPAVTAGRRRPGRAGGR